MFVFPRSNVQLNRVKMGVGDFLYGLDGTDQDLVPGGTQMNDPFDFQACHVACCGKGFQIVWDVYEIM